MNTSIPALQFLLLVFTGVVNRRQQDAIDYLKEENRVLREQLEERRLRLTDDQRRRLAVKGHTLGRKLLDELCTIVTPDTIMLWYRKLVARKYDGSTNRKSGRPTTHKDIVSLVVWIANDNPSFGYTKIRDALKNLGHTIGRNTVKRILQDHGIEPAPERTHTTSWRTFINAHIQDASIAATDFFTVEMLTLRGLVRFHVLFVIDIATRRVHIAGITLQPDETWMMQVARNLTNCMDGFLRNTRYLILDRDPMFTAAFRRMLKDYGVNPVRLLAQSPNLNAYAERFVLSIKSECLDRMIILGESHLRRVVAEYVAYYNHERCHQGLDRIIDPDETAGRTEGKVVRRQRLGGMLNYYYREAA